jgi:hypothetical protein
MSVLVFWELTVDYVTEFNVDCIACYRLHSLCRLPVYRQVCMSHYQTNCLPI